MSGESSAARTLPPEVDPAFYRANYPDLAALGDAAVIDHFDRWGADEGRCASPLATRDGFIAAIAAQESGRVLEVGPGCAPIMMGAKVRYFDMVAAEQLGPGAPRIHYVGKIDALPRSFDAAVACRSLGHHPDLIGHLQAIGRVLVDGGLYYLILPDARFTAAALMPHASAAALIEAHREQRQHHSLASLIDAREWRLEDGAEARLRGQITPPTLAVRTRRVAAAIEEHDDGGDHRDIEAWRFTPALFRDLMTMLHEFGLSPFAPSRVWPTPAGADGFCAVLEKA